MAQEGREKHVPHHTHLFPALQQRLLQHVQILRQLLLFCGRLAAFRHQPFGQLFLARVLGRQLFDASHQLLQRAQQASKTVCEDIETELE